MPKTYAVPPPPHHNEGKTVAAWTMNLGIVAGSIPIAAGMILPDQTLMIWIGAAIIVLALLAGAVLSKLGLGQPRGYGEPVAEAAAERGEVAAATRETAEADAR